MNKYDVAVIFKVQLTSDVLLLAGEVVQAKKIGLQNVIIPIWTASMVDLRRSIFNHSIASADPHCTHVLYFSKIRQYTAELLMIHQIIPEPFFGGETRYCPTLLQESSKFGKRHMAMALF